MVGVTVRRRWQALAQRARALPPAQRARAAACALLVLALALPRWSLERESWDAIMVFDITQSMDVEDVGDPRTHQSRLQFARAQARAALATLPCGTRIGWGAFAESRTLLLLAPVEVCAHYADLLATLENIDGRMRWGNASEIAKGVSWAIRTAKADASHADIVFLTDGHEAPPAAEDDTRIFDDVRDGSIHGWLIGVGGDAPQAIPRTDADGKRIGTWRAEDVVQRADDPHSAEQLSRLHERHLEALAHGVGFDYARLQDAATLRDALVDRRHARRRTLATDLAWLPAALALALLAWCSLPVRAKGNVR